MGATEGDDSGSTVGTSGDSSCTRIVWTSSIFTSHGSVEGESFGCTETREEELDRRESAGISTADETIGRSSGGPIGSGSTTFGSSGATISVRASLT